MNPPKTRRENEVWQACDDLWAVNNSTEALKGDRIRDQLVQLGYKKGSPNEIYKYRSSWKESRGISEKNLAQSAQVADPISRAVSLVYEQIQQETQQKITAIQCDSTAQVEKLVQENQELSSSLEKLQEKHEALQIEKDSLEISLELLKENLSKAEQKNKELNMRQEGLELLLSELRNTYTAQIKQMGLMHSEKINEAKLEIRVERDLNKKFERLLKQEFQKLGTLVKKIKIPKTKPRKAKKAPSSPLSA